MVAPATDLLHVAQTTDAINSSDLRYPRLHRPPHSPQTKRDTASMPTTTMEAPPYKFPPTPLQQLSPERLNAGPRRPSSATSKMSSAIDAQNPSPLSSPSRKPNANLFADYDPHRQPVKETGFALTGSPSLPEIHAFRSHGRTNSDVQGLVKRFEHLDVRDRDAESTERRKRHEAELRRAQIGREEAENDVARLREEARRLKKENDESRDRERQVTKRLEVVKVGGGNHVALWIFDKLTHIAGGIRQLQGIPCIATGRVQGRQPQDTQGGIQVIISCLEATRRTQVHSNYPAHITAGHRY